MVREPLESVSFALGLFLLVLGCSEETARKDVGIPDGSTPAGDAAPRDAGFSADADIPADAEAEADAGPDAGSTTLAVSTSAQLSSALSSAAPGTLIALSPGTYTGAFSVEVSGDEGRPVTIRGPSDRSAVLDGDFNVPAWQGVVTLESQHHITMENLEIRNTRGERYGVLVGATDQSADGSHHIELRNLHVHNVGEEIIKVQGRNTHDILIESCVVHTNQDWSGIDIQGHWGGTPPYDEKPRRVVIRNNLIYDIPNFAGIGNEFADNVQAYENVILGSAIGLDIGCGNYNVVYNNLVTSFDHFNTLLTDPSYTAIDLSRYQAFSGPEIAGFSRQSCADGIALSGNYMSLVLDNEIVDCTDNGDLILSYNHMVQGTQHNVRHGHAENLFARNVLHDNDAYRTIREYDKQTNGISQDQLFLHNVFAKNQSDTALLFEHSVSLTFVNNTLVDGDDVELLEESTLASIKNNVFFASNRTVSADSTGADVSHNCDSSDSSLFADYAAGNYHLSSANGAACIDAGFNLSATLQARFNAYHGIYDSEYAFYEDFATRVPFDFEQDIDGNTHGASWDMGAYASPE